MTCVITFSAKTAVYACHVATCAASHTNEDKGIYRVRAALASVEQAKAHADADEQAKGGERAAWKVCPCAKKARK